MPAAQPVPSRAGKIDGVQSRARYRQETDRVAALGVFGLAYGH